MANYFKVHDSGQTSNTTVDDNGMPTYAELVGGFNIGGLIKAASVNTPLKESTLLATALIDAFQAKGSNSANAGVNMTVAQLSTVIQNCISNFTVNAAVSSTYASKIISDTTNVGAENQFAYVKNGVVTASALALGSVTKPVYFLNGIITACNDYPVVDSVRTWSTEQNFTGGLKKNGKEVATTDQIPTVPTKISQLTNDSGFVSAPLTDLGIVAQLPVKGLYSLKLEVYSISSKEYIEMFETIASYDGFSHVYGFTSGNGYAYAINVSATGTVSPASSSERVTAILLVRY